MNKKKIKNIFKAFTEKLPVEEKWYKDRLSICESCPFNSSNVEKTSFETKTISKTVCGGKSVCTACGCCTERKAAIKAETCGLVEKPEWGQPRWDAIEIEGSKRDSNIIVECMKQEDHRYVYAPSEKQDSFEVSFASSENVVNIPFKISRTGKSFKVKQVSASCGCTASKTTENEDGTVDVKFSISLKKFDPGKTSVKTAKVVYLVGGREEKEIYFKFKITKNG